AGDEAVLGGGIAKATEVVALAIPLRVATDDQRVGAAKLGGELQRGTHLVEIHVRQEVVAEALDHLLTGVSHGLLELLLECGAAEPIDPVGIGGRSVQAEAEAVVAGGDGGLDELKRWRIR